MASKKLSVCDFTALTGQYAFIERLADGYILENSASTGHTLGAFYSQATVADKKIPLTENAVLLGIYEATENRVAFNDGKYMVRYAQSTGNIIMEEDWDIESDDIKIVNDLIEDILRNKMTVVDATGAVTLYADNSTTPLKTTTLSDDSTTTTRLRLA
jgi:hypothetical protein